MNRSRRRHHCAVVTTLAMTMGIWAGGARGQAAGGGAAAPTAGSTGTPAPRNTAPGGANPASPGAAASSAGAAAAGATTTATPTPAVAAPITLSAGAYSNPNGGRPEIDNFVNLNVQNLLNDGNADAQTKARDVLTAATQTAGAPAAPAFLFEYGSSLNNAFTARLGGRNKLSVRQRLNIAIVTQRVAKDASNLTLQGTTLALLKDEAEPVVLWALKAAQPQVPFVLGMKAVGNKPHALIGAISESAFKHPSGPVFEEAYQALSGDDRAIADELMKLWQNRLTQYQTKVPQDPSADARPIFKLTTSGMWKAVINTPPLQQKVMQMVADQMSAAQQWADRAEGDDTRAQLVALARQGAAGCYVVGQHQKLAALSSAGDTAQKELDPKTFKPGTKVGPVVDPVVKQIIADFKGVQQPPTVGPAPAANGVAHPGAGGVGQP